MATHIHEWKVEDKVRSGTLEGLNNIEQFSLQGTIGNQVTDGRAAFRLLDMVQNLTLPSNRGAKRFPGAEHSFTLGDKYASWTTYFFTPFFKTFDSIDTLNALNLLYGLSLPDVFSELRRVREEDLNHRYQIPSAYFTALINAVLLGFHSITQTVQLGFQYLALPSMYQKTALELITGKNNNVLKRLGGVALYLVLTPFQAFGLVAESINYVRHVVDGAVTLARELTCSIIDVVSHLLVNRGFDLDTLLPDLQRRASTSWYAFKDGIKNVFKLVPVAAVVVLSYFTFGAGPLALNLAAPAVPAINASLAAKFAYYGTLISQGIAQVLVNLPYYGALAYLSKGASVAGYRIAQGVQTFLTKSWQTISNQLKRLGLLRDSPLTKPVELQSLKSSVEVRPMRVISFDFDGCLFHQKYQKHYMADKLYEGVTGEGDLEKRSVVATNLTLLNSIKNSNEDYSETLVMNGSERQSKTEDMARSKENVKEKKYETEYSYLALGRVATFIGAHVDNFLLADVDPDKSLAWGISHRAAVEEDYKGKHREWQPDSSKLTILYAQLHKIAIEHPHQKIVFDFYDDDVTLLVSLGRFFNNNDTLIPDNITLQLHHYNPDLPKPEMDMKVIQGQGSIDQHFNKTITSMHTKADALGGFDKLVQQNEAQDFPTASLPKPENKPYKRVINLKPTLFEIQWKAHLYELQNNKHAKQVTEDLHETLSTYVDDLCSATNPQTELNAFKKRANAAIDQAQQKLDDKKLLGKIGLSSADFKKIKEEIQQTVNEAQKNIPPKIGH